MDVGTSQKDMKDQIEFGTNKYTTYYKGDPHTNIILIAPHGGNLKPDTITDRIINNDKREKPDTISTISDRYTKEIALMLRSELEKLTSRVPHLVVCNLHRGKCDANREKYIATFNEPDAVLAFNEFHSFIDKAKAAVGQGVVFDIHGQTHPEEWVELGYCLSNKNICDGDFKTKHSSINALAKRSKFNLCELINGDKSLGYFLQNEGIKTVPSPECKLPSKHCYTGGYNIHCHGSQYRGAVDAIQIETPSQYRNPDRAYSYVKCLAKAIANFMYMHY